MNEISDNENNRRIIMNADSSSGVGIDYRTAFAISLIHNLNYLEHRIKPEQIMVIRIEGVTQFDDYADNM